MKPIRLTFNGINSFSEKTEIDFKKLTAGGLFGIFGDTGSGKSTVLDCINFALYGDVDRSKKKTDIINYDCEQAEVSFEFNLLSEGKRQTYLVERTLKKKSGLGKATLYVKDGETLSCIADNTTSVNAKTEELLGLGADDFRKCIALPQGEFAQFVQSSPADRFKLIERLFSLSRYGDRLKERILQKENETEAEYREINGELTAYGDVSEETIKLCSENIEKDKKELETLNAKCDEAKKYYERLYNLSENKKLLDDTRSELEELERKKTETEELRKVIKALPVCNAIVGYVKEVERKRAALDEDDKKYTFFIEKLAKTEEEIKKIESEIKSADREGVDRALREKLAAYETAATTVEELKKERESLLHSRSAYKETALAAKRAYGERETAAREYAEAKKAYDGCEKTDIGEVLENKLKPAILKEEYQKELVFLGELREEIKGYDDTSNLYLFVKEVLTERMDYYGDLILDAVGGKMDVKAEIDRLKKETDEKERLFKIADGKRERLAEAEKQIALSEREVERIQKDGEQQSARVERLVRALQSIFGEGEENYAAATEAVKKRIKENDELRESELKRIDGLKKEVESVKTNAEIIKSRRESLVKEIEATDKKIADSLKKSGFDSVEECTAVAERALSYGDAEETVKSFDARLIALTERKARLEKLKGIEEATRDAVKYAENDYNALNAALKDKHADVRLGETRLKEFSIKLEKKKLTEKKRDEVKGRLDTVSALKELTRGNKFLEYIAGEYLSDISKAASVTLLKLSGGRYFLSYLDTFYVGDNFNEGNLRGVNTLSGGETFLVSLSLALALSAEICRGSMRSIEFFFLDEGFGTLDDGLIDTVMDSLEKLKSADFTIGVISHVEELKHRIGNKIIVNKATETHGSTVAFSYEV